MLICLLNPKFGWFQILLGISFLINGNHLEKRLVTWVVLGEAQIVTTLFLSLPDLTKKKTTETGHVCVS